MSSLRTADPEIYEVIRKETERQAFGLELIPSENFVSEAVLEATGSVLTNKYAEGYPGKRYYGGCEFVDQAEELAIERAKKLFGAEHANVQPHSGSQANMAVYLAVMNPGDMILGMNLSHGGHLTNGSPVNFSGKLFQVVAYGVRPDTETIDFDQVRDLARAHRPKLIVVGASAYPRIIDFEPFRKIADEAGCMVMADIAHVAGLVAAGLHPNPVPYCEFVTTTTHKTLRGPRAGRIPCRAGRGKKPRGPSHGVRIPVNKTTTPFEPRSPFVTSGIRFGTPGVTTRGMGEKEMERIGNIIADVLSAPGAARTEKRVAAGGRDPCGAFPP